jgi:hypothetical protein
MKANWRTGILLVVVSCFLGCQTQQTAIVEEENPIILELNSRAYSLEQFRFFVSRKYPEGLHLDQNEVQSAYLDAFSRELYLYEIAVDLGYRPSNHQIETFIRDQLTSMSFHLLPPEEQTLWRDAIGRRLAIRSMMQSEVLKHAEIQDDAVEAYYQEHTEDFKREQHYRLRFFRTPEKELADKFREDLRKSREPFTTVADQQEGHDGSHKLAVELTREALLKPFYAAIRRMKPGQYSKVIPVEQGETQSYYVLYLEAVLPPRQISYDEAQHEIRTKLQQASAQSFIEEQMQAYRARLQLAIKRDSLPFQYIDPNNRSES